MRKFIIYYNNGDVVYGGGDADEDVTLTFSKKWLEAPSDGVSCIVYEEYSTGRQILMSNEFFYQLPAEHHGKGAIGGSMKIGPYLRQLTDIGGIVKFGGWTDDQNYDALISKAMKGDDYLPPVSCTRVDSTEDDSD